MRIALVLLAGLTAFFSTVAASDIRGDRAYERIIAEFVVPGYRALAEEADAHADGWATFCREPSGIGIDALHISFHRLADAWAAIEIVRSGPVAEEYRSDGLYHWPERRNAVERALKALLTARNPADLEPEAMRAASAAIQGLPALERLLFGGTPPVGALAGGGDSLFRCQAGAAIARNAAAIAAEIRSALAAPRPPPDTAAKAALATSIVTAYSTLKDRKIGPVLGKDKGSVKPGLAEAWRSGRSLRDIEINLRSLSAVAAIALDGLTDDIALPFTTDTALDVSRSLKGDLGAIAAGDRRFDLVLLRDAVAAAEDRAILEIPVALGVVIGFNSLDGD